MVFRRRSGFLRLKSVSCHGRILTGYTPSRSKSCVSKLKVWFGLSTMPEADAIYDELRAVLTGACLFSEENLALLQELGRKAFGALRTQRSNTSRWQSNVVFEMFPQLPCVQCPSQQCRLISAMTSYLVHGTNEAMPGRIKDEYPRSGIVRRSN